MPDGFWLISAGVVGAILGSFFNVVIARLPGLIEATETSLSVKGIVVLLRGLSYPGSMTPCCSKVIPWYYNVPIISWLMLRGRCAFCCAPINVRYFVVELLTALIFMGIFGLYGFAPQALSLAILSSCMICLFFIDLETFLLPDVLTLTCALIGLFFSAVGFTDVDLEDAVLGGLVGFLVPWSIAKIYFLARNSDGLGGGDIKLIMVMGIWSGWIAVFSTLFLASILGLCTIIAANLFYKKTCDLTQPVPFGPFLIGAYFATSIFKMVPL